MFSNKCKNKYQVVVASTAIEILNKDKEYQKIMLELRHNADKYFNSYNKKSDKEVSKGEEIEKELTQKAEKRMSELGIYKKGASFIKCDHPNLTGKIPNEECPQCGFETPF